MYFGSNRAKISRTPGKTWMCWWPSIYFGYSPKISLNFPIWASHSSSTYNTKMIRLLQGRQMKILVLRVLYFILIFIQRSSLVTIQPTKQRLFINDVSIFSKYSCYLTKLMIHFHFTKVIYEPLENVLAAKFIFLNPSHSSVTICLYFLLLPSHHVTVQKVTTLSGNHLMLRIVNLIINRWSRR